VASAIVATVNRHNAMKPLSMRSPIEPII
jgi:hypothetical protein